MSLSNGGQVDFKSGIYARFHFGLNSTSPEFSLASLSMAFFDIRRARLRPSYAALYPDIAPGLWISAQRATRTVLAGMRRRQHLPPEGARVLAAEHFDFRGGRALSRGRSQDRTRVTDRAPAVPAPARNGSTAGSTLRRVALLGLTGIVLGYLELRRRRER